MFRLFSWLTWTIVVRPHTLHYYEHYLQLYHFYVLFLWIYHYVMENGENQHTFVRRSEIAFPSARHSIVRWDTVKQIWLTPCLTVSHVSRQCSTLKNSVWFCPMISDSVYCIWLLYLFWRIFFLLVKKKQPYWSIADTRARKHVGYIYRFI